MNNSEIYAAYLTGEWTGELPQPRPIRKELYLAYLCGLDVGEKLPAPRTRFEMYLYTLAQNGAGGGVELPELLNPATAAQILAGYDAIDQNGKVLTGTNDLEEQNARLEGRLNGDGSLGEDWYITDASYLFYYGARIDRAVELLSKCKGLTALNGMFYNSSKTLDAAGLSALAKLDTSEVTTMENMFRSCSARMALDLSAWDTGKVTDMSGMFQMSGITDVGVLSGWETSKVTDMSEMFSNSRFANLDLSGWDTSNVAAMNNMFASCGQLQNLNLGGWSTANVTNMSYMFNACKIAAIDMSNWDTGKVTNMSGMLSACSLLEEIIGFSATNKAGLTIGFPNGSASQPSALKRLTFRTDLDVPAMRSAINIKWCSFTREGLVEMFESLNAVDAALNSSYRTITITGNPAIPITLPGNPSYSSWSYSNLITFAQQKVENYPWANYMDLKVQYYFSGESASTAVTCAVSDIPEDLFGEFTLRMRFVDSTIVPPDGLALTDSDRALATSKNWILVE